MLRVETAKVDIEFRLDRTLLSTNCGRLVTPGTVSPRTGTGAESQLTLARLLIAPVVGSLTAPNLSACRHGYDHGARKYILRVAGATPRSTANIFRAVAGYRRRRSRLADSWGWRGNASPNPCLSCQNPAVLKINGPTLTFAHCRHHARFAAGIAAPRHPIGCAPPPKRGFHRKPMAGIADADTSAVFAASVSLRSSATANSPWRPRL